MGNPTENLSEKFDEAYKYLTSLSGQLLEVQNGNVRGIAEVEVKQSSGQHPAPDGEIRIIWTRPDLIENYFIGEPGSCRSGLVSITYVPRRIYEETLLGESPVFYGDSKTTFIYPGTEERAVKPWSPGWEKYQRDAEIKAIYLIRTLKLRSRLIKS